MITLTETSIPLPFDTVINSYPDKCPDWLQV